MKGVFHEKGIRIFHSILNDDFEVTYDEYMTDSDIVPRSRRTSGYGQRDLDTESWDMPDDTDDPEDTTQIMTRQIMTMKTHFPDL